MKEIYLRVFQLSLERFSASCWFFRLGQINVGTCSVGLKGWLRVSFSITEWVTFVGAAAFKRLRFWNSEPFAGRLKKFGLNRNSWIFILSQSVEITWCRVFSQDWNSQSRSFSCYFVFLTLKQVSPFELDLFFLCPCWFYRCRQRPVRQYCLTK